MIIGVTGTNGAGKGTVVDYLVREKGFTHYSVREFLIEEIKRRGLPVNRSTMRETANDLRKSNHPGYVVEQLVTRAAEAGTDAVIESIRAVGEVEFLKHHDAFFIAIDADRPIRYERAVQRNSETDQVDFDTWVQEEEREWHNTEAHDMNVPAVMGMADVTILNNGTHEDLFKEVDKALTILLEL
jgi:dephospho-CoA kinase